MSKFFTKEDTELNQFYQLPKVLIHDEKYKDLTANAKIAYAILKDRHSVSIKNSWIDEQNRVYFYFKDKDLAKLLDMTVKTASRIKKQLKDHDLIHVEQQGMNQAAYIYLLKPEKTVETNDDKARTKMSSPTKTKKSMPARTKMSSPEQTKMSINSNTNSSNTDLSNTNMSNLSINERDIQKMDVPMEVQKQLILNKDRLMEHSIHSSDIELMYNASKEKMNASAFAYVLSNVLENTEGKIRSFKKVMDKSIQNYFKQSQDAEYEDLKGKESNEVIPDWFKERNMVKQETDEAASMEKEHDSMANDPDFMQKMIAEIRQEQAEYVISKGVR